MPLPLVPNNGLAEQVDAETVDLILEVPDAVGSAATRPGTYPVPEDAPGWVVKAVDRTGAVVTELPHANPKTVVFTLNAEDEIAFDSPKGDPATAEVRPLATEVQVYRNDDLKSWGVVVGATASSDAGAVSFTARGLWWYLRKRFFGTATRRNMIPNGTFETGPATGVMNEAIPGWTRVGGVRTRHYTAATKAGGHGLPDPLRGTKAVSMDNPDTGENAYLRARWSYRTDFPPGQRVTFAAWVYIADGWIGPAALGLGLYVARVVGGIVTDQAFVAVDDETPRGEWVRLECSLIVRPGIDGALEVRLYSPGGWVTWDESVSVLMESTGSGFAGADQTALAATFVNYGQTGAGKSPLGIGTDCPPTGVIRRRAHQHADHAWIADSVDELAAFPDGFDYEVAVTPRTRTFRTHFPRQGADLSDDVVLRLGRTPADGNLASYRTTDDGASVATSVVARGQGDGPDREEGSAVDTSDLDGLVLDAFVDAPADLPIGELDDYAADELDVAKDVIRVLEVTTHPGAADLIDTIGKGCLVTVEIDDGYVVVGGVWRVVRISIDCPTDTMTLTLNRWTP